MHQKIRDLIQSQLMIAPKYQHLPNGSYQLKEEHIDEVAQHLASSFSRKNVVWSKANTQLLKLKEFFLVTLKNHLYMQKKTCALLGRKIFNNTILIQNGYITACIMQEDIEQYRNNTVVEKPPELHIFKKLQEAGKKLMEKIDLSSQEAGKCCYFTFGFRSNAGRNQTIPSNLAFVEQYRLIRDQGYRNVYGRISSDKIKELFLMVGGVMLSEVAIDLEKGKQHTLYMAKLDLDNPVFVKYIDAVDQFRAKQRNTQAKL